MEDSASVSSLICLLMSNKILYSERSSNSTNRDRCFPRTKQAQHGNIIDDSKFVVGDKMHSVRYFVIKSLNYENIQLSVEKGIWATQPMNEPILEEAFDSSSKVILVFSVNKSGFFNGYAQMMSSVGQRPDSVWSQGTGANNSWGRSFEVKWLCLCNLPFYKTLHLKNPLNEYKPVKISRDCQELPSEVGEALCTLIDREFEEDPNMMRRHDLEPGCSFPEETGNASPNDMIWGATYMFHPSLLHQYHLEANGWHSAHSGSGGVYPSDDLTIPNKRPNSKGHVPVDSSGMPGEMSLFGSTLTEEEFLEMTYEEYLEAHDRSTTQLCHQAGGQQWKKGNSSSNEIDSEDLNSNSDHVSSSKTSHH